MHQQCAVKADAVGVSFKLVFAVKHRDAAPDQHIAPGKAGLSLD